MENLDITVILTLGFMEELDDNTVEKLDMCLDSIALGTVKPKFILACFSSNSLGEKFGPLMSKWSEYTAKTNGEFEKLGGTSFKILLDDIASPEEYSLQKVINDAAEQTAVPDYLNTKYFSIWDLTCSCSPGWFETAGRYLKKSSYPGKNNRAISLWLPLSKTVDDVNGEFTDFNNKQYWAIGFTSQDLDLGYMDEESLKANMDVNILGAIIETQSYLFAGGLKKSLKILYWYEFLLRFHHMGKTGYVIPKSLFTVEFPSDVKRAAEILSGGLSREEIEFYYSTVLKEYAYRDDRNKTYTGN
jgi:hypothetical protein